MNKLVFNAILFRFFLYIRIQIKNPYRPKSASYLRQSHQKPKTRQKKGFIRKKQHFDTRICCLHHCHGLHNLKHDVRELFELSLGVMVSQDQIFVIHNELGAEILKHK